MKLPVYSLKGQKVSEMTVPAGMLVSDVRSALIHQAVRALLSRTRRPTGHTLGRGKVRGGGAKPWRQKGTGRARHGSIRAPQWVGGGVVGGPTPAVRWTETLPKRIGREAFRMALSNKISDKKLILLDKLSLTQPKTKALRKLLEPFRTFGKKLLIIAPKTEDNVVRAGRNLPNVSVRKVTNVSLLDLVRNDLLLAPKEVVGEFQTRLKESS